MTQQKLLHSLQSYIFRHKLIQQGEKILISVSGGIDSVVLLDLLCELKKYFKMDIAIVHCNHQLRGQESDEDESFVKLLAKEYGLDVYIKKINTTEIAEKEKISIQEAARKARYDFFSELRLTHRFDKITTAHNADDNAETIIFNLIRGTGVRGLTGIPVLRKDESIIRPLLFASREQIEKYADAKKLRFREDSSNLKTDYTRNLIRHKLIPLMRENINPNLANTLQRTGELFLQLEEYINDVVDNLTKQSTRIPDNDQIIIEINKLIEQPFFIKEQFFLTLARNFSKSQIQSGTVETMMAIANGATGSFGSVTKDVTLYRDRDSLILKRGESAKPFSFPVTYGKAYLAGRAAFSAVEVPEAFISTDPNIEFVDGEKLREPIRLRSWMEGDWFVPLGMKEPKKLSDFFIDRKTPLLEKKMIPLFTACEDIVWVCGLRLDDRYKITPATKKIIKLEYRVL